MRLLLRRDQRAGLLGKVVFSLDVRADLSDEERANIRKYKLGDTELYASHDISGGSGLLGLASRLAWKAVTIKISVNDLANGKKVEAKDIVEMLAIEDQIREAAKTFKAVLEAASHFGGEEVVEI
jgi:F420-0:gamma-glutamyl ligase-like protein